MFFTIDPGGDVPIYEQIVRQIKLAVADGVLARGQMVPSVRQLASELAINPNTIARAYQQLQSDLVLEPLRGRGLVVRRDAAQRCTKARNSIVADSVRQAISDAISGGMSPGELRNVFDAELQRHEQSSVSATESNSPASENRDENHDGGA